ncbi:hypothetical protein PAXRUDRAFT_829572 [Paxillus rubicundulus Ve08.2h10]|uniref:Uncharacterized protein n=1 Tax=Paxillus rubicundulus Ve08.2h10 TaxID=930991 RepID=A0A0D0DZY6_9AGAM|nr:hypothetical protein PAXRUDRAFT_829572 [Paxillus rubicundulus Ve08.2h10]
MLSVIVTTGLRNPNLPVSLALSRVSIPVSFYTFSDPHMHLYHTSHTFILTIPDPLYLYPHLFITPAATCTPELMDLSFCRS